MLTRITQRNTTILVEVSVSELEVASVGGLPESESSASPPGLVKLARGIRRKKKHIEDKNQEDKTPGSSKADPMQESL